MTHRLITIGPSHYCEKARWALDRLAIPYREECHPPLLHVVAARRNGGQRTVPVLVAPDSTLADSTDILQHLDRCAPPELRLYPAASEPRLEVEQWEDLFDERMGPHVRRFVYGHVIWDRRMLASLTHGVRRREKLLFRAGLPILRRLIIRFLRIDHERVERSRQRILEVFERVEQTLADGRPYLTGERFTAADLTFAALAAPVLAPAEYGFPLPPIAEAPLPLQEAVEAFRARPAGAFGLRLYAKDR